MKTIYLKRSLWLAAILLISLSVGAQTKTTAKTAYQMESNNMYYRIRNDGDRRIEDVQTEYSGKLYRIQWVNEKMTSLLVDGERIPEANWSKYSDVTGHIREEIKEQEKRNEEQAIRNEEQARLNADQQKRNSEQVIRNQEQAKRNEEQARLNADQQKRNAEQAIRNQEQEKRNAGQAGLNEIQAKRNAEQAIRNQEQAKKNEEQARANAQMIKDITADLVSDKIIPGPDSLYEMKLNEFGMSVNGVKQPEEVFKKYKEKYSKFFEGNFTNSRDGVIKGQ